MLFTALLLLAGISVDAPSTSMECYSRVCVFLCVCLCVCACVCVYVHVFVEAGMTGRDRGRYQLFNFRKF